MKHFNIARRQIVPVLLLLTLLFWSGPVRSQTYYPGGDPKKWNVSLTPFLWMPWVSGSITAGQLSQEFEAPAIDLIKNIKLAFMVTAEVSKGKFFASPSYIYTKLGSETVHMTDKDGNPAVTSVPELKMNIVQFIVGGKLPAGQKFIFKPNAGFRYNYIATSVSIQRPSDTSSYKESIEFWDPVVGIMINYNPLPRFPLTLNTNIGGFGAGSRLSWLASLTGGYTISPVFDLLGGFMAYGFDYHNTTTNGVTTSLTNIMYGFDLGIRINIPQRGKDPEVFKKFRE